MMYRLHHVTRYAYGSAVGLAAHLLHLRPRSLACQRVLSEQLTADPTPIRTTEGIDHFGNRVTWLFLDRRHDAFSIASEAVVDVCFPDLPPPETTMPWEAVVAAGSRSGPESWQAAEFRFDSPLAPAIAAAGAFARKSFPRDRPVLEALLDLNARIHHDFTFRAGVTTLTTPVAEVLKRREGVCQDFAHLMISALRSLGLPARYTSGYIRTRPRPGTTHRRGADQSHAWVGAWLGPAHGWAGLDPTNGIVVREEHVLVAWGRDYGDVSPVRGVILGGGTHMPEVSVDLDPINDN